VSEAAESNIPRETEVEIQSNESPQHYTAETFPWPPKEQYFEHKESFVQNQLPVVIEALINDPDYPYKHDKPLTYQIAKLYSRVLFAKAVMSWAKPDPAVPIHNVASSSMPDS
jgi:hypothetical protein